MKPQRQEQHRSKNEFIFTFESHDTLKSFVLFIIVKTIAILNPEHSDILKKKKKKSKISRRGSRFPDSGKLDNFALLSCRGQQRNVPRILTQVYSPCAAH